MEFSVEYMKRWLSANRRRYFDWGVLIALIVTMFWLLSNFIAPFLASPGTIDLGEDGVTGRLSTLENNGEEIAQIDNDYARAVYNAGDANCHQHASRSFFLNDNQMPFCARCTAIFLGVVIGVAILMFLVIELNIWMLLLGLVPMGLDGGIQLLTDYESNNLFRFITGTIAGITAGLALGYIISEIGHEIVIRRKIRKGSE